MRLSDLDLEQHLKVVLKPERDENWIPTEDWMKRKKPSTVEVRLHAAEDYAREEQRIAFLRSGKDCVLSIVEGSSYYSQVWIQFDLEAVFEKIDISCCPVFQHADRRST